MNGEEYDACKDCIASIKLLIEDEEVLICQAYGVRVDDDDCCSIFMNKTKEG